jgi:23S rRNA maturation-related 3'-5' exoribonuclease YhaM
MVLVQEKEQVFKDELELIFDKKVREFTRLCIVSAPDYFFTDCPASSTGKYHPLNELGPDGTIIHTKKVFTVAYELCRGMDCEDNRDVILAACLVHDLIKQGWTCTGHTHKMHPAFGAQLIENVQRDTQILDEDRFMMMRNCVGYHYGLWSHGDWKKPLSEYTREELCVYLSDYIASKRCIEVSYKR